MIELLRRPVGNGVVRVVATERTDGDVHPRRTPPDILDARQRTATGRSWVMLDQVHGSDRIDLRGGLSGRPVVGVGDVLVGDTSHAVAVWAADCASLILVGADGTMVGCHAGWRGLAGGVIDVAVSSSSAPAAVVLGPCIHPCCYEFGEEQLAVVAAGIGVPIDEIRGVTSSGSPALDVPAAVAAALARHGLSLDVVGPCTGCDDRWFSHRRGDEARHALVAWSEMSSSEMSSSEMSS